MRTIKELELAALTLRARLLDEHKPLGNFIVTQEEMCLIRDQPIEYQMMTGLPDTFCGLKVLTV